MEVMDHQRNALTVLQRIATCVEKEAESWRSGVAALQKAWQEEEKQRKKLEEKEKKDAEKKRIKEEKQAERDRQRKQQKERREAEQAAQAEQADDGDGAAAQGPRRRRTGAAAGELEESDPAILRKLRTGTRLTPTWTSDELKDFVSQVAQHPEVPAILRLKKGIIKKVLHVTWHCQVVYVM